MTSTQSTGSLVNLVTGSARNAEPEVGMGVTFLFWTDRSAGTVSEVVNPKTIKVREDKSTRTDSNGMSDTQSYTYEEDPDAPEQIYTLRKNGRWIRKGESIKDGSRIAVGRHDTYHDFSF